MSVSCGPCNLCCRVLDIEELQKPAHVLCSHAGDGVCTNYARRPLQCRKYQCLYSLGLLDESERPDRLGALFQHNEHMTLQCHVAPEVLSWQTGPLGQLIGAMSLDAPVMVVHGETSAIVTPKAAPGFAFPQSLRQ